jgi:hypothetical protein
MFVTGATATARQISIRRDDTSGWHVVNGNGIVLAGGTNAAALAWVGQHNTDRVRPWYV